MLKWTLLKGAATMLTFYNSLVTFKGTFYKL